MAKYSGIHLVIPLLHYSNFQFEKCNDESMNFFKNNGQQEWVLFLFYLPPRDDPSFVLLDRVLNVEIRK